MALTRFYYQFKPYIPTPVRIALRRWHATRIRAKCSDVWPIKESAGKPPEGWRGWPDNKRFALVLTHDVESEFGLARVRRLAELEMQLGFRSSFNFIPEGSYQVPMELLEWLVSQGFEVGVHDLHHDGQLYRSRTKFVQNAAHINDYLKNWDAVGFRSGFMLNELDWLHDLDIRYDASTFDTDPFEPQPDAVDTIFPFWVPAPKQNGRVAREQPVEGRRAGIEGQSAAPLTSESTVQALTDPRRKGYVELPYTLPQDSTLFLFLREQSIDLWKKKLDWVAERGGMVLLDTHPDYMAIGGDATKVSEYPVSHYADLLYYIRSKHEGSYWSALPREVAEFVQTSSLVTAKPHFRRSGRRSVGAKPKIWVDLDNTPHVPFFEPILNELRSRGFPLIVTARDAFQVCDLADKKGLDYIKVGRHHGKNRALKALGLMYRAMQLSRLVLREKPALAVSHGARSQLLLSNFLRIPTLLIEDYEHSQFPVMMRPKWVMAPEMIPDSALFCKNGHIRKYAGIKEDAYVWSLVPDRQLLTNLGINESDLVVTARPPATEAHYHNPESELLFERFMDRACRTPGVRIVLLPRNAKQGSFIQSSWPAWFEGGKTIIPSTAIDGLNLMWHSDLVVSGGGTMNREAAALGVPVYSIFRGTIGAVDRQLKAEGRLVLIESIDDVDRKIELAKRPRRPIVEVTSRATLHTIVDAIEEIAEASVRAA